jgi:hypothetical protein
VLKTSYRLALLIVPVEVSVARQGANPGHLDEVARPLGYSMDYGTESWIDSPDARNDAESGGYEGAHMMSSISTVGIGSTNWSDGAYSGYDESWQEDVGAAGESADDYTVVTPINAEHAPVIQHAAANQIRVSTTDQSRFMKYSKELDSAAARQKAELEAWRYEKEQQRSQRSNASSRFNEAEEDLMFGLKISTKPEDPQRPAVGQVIDQKQFLTAHHMELFPCDELAVIKQPEPEPEDEGPPEVVIPLTRLMWLAHHLCCCFLSKVGASKIGEDEDPDMNAEGAAPDMTGLQDGAGEGTEEIPLLARLCSCCSQQRAKVLGIAANDDEGDNEGDEEGLSSNNELGEGGEGEEGWAEKGEGEGGGAWGEEGSEGKDVGGTGEGEGRMDEQRAEEGGAGQNENHESGSESGVETKQETKKEAKDRAKKEKKAAREKTKKAKALAAAKKKLEKEEVKTKKEKEGVGEREEIQEIQETQEAQEALEAGGEEQVDSGEGRGGS